jgi:hypothetical protein
MAQLEPLVFQALTGLVGGRVYPDIAPTNTPRPYITWQQVGGMASVLDRQINYARRLCVAADQHLGRQPSFRLAPCASKWKTP